MIPLAATLPENSNDGYVAAAYIVFFAIVLIYVAIMAIRLSRVERSVRELRKDARQREAGDGRAPEEDLGRSEEGSTRQALGRPQERETV
jgi:hypothetical protein